VAAEPPADRRRADRPRHDVAGYGIWGFSPSNTPEGGYGAYGVDAVGMDPNGNPSNEDRTLVDRGFAGCPGATRSPTRRRAPTPTAWSRRTPRSSRCATGQQATVADLTRLEAIPDMYGKWGFRDSVNTTTNHVSDGYLSLDQGMAMAALGNALGDDVMRSSFATQSFKQAIRPVLGVGGVQRLAARLHDHRHRWRRRPERHVG
jgi:hypothetical protein